MRLCFLRFLMCKTVPNLAHNEVIIQLHRNSSLSHGLKAHTVTARQWRVKKFSIWGRTKFTAKIWTLSEASDIFGLNVLIVIFSDSALWKHIIANEKGLDLYVATFHISWGSFRDSVSSNAEWQLRPYFKKNKIAATGWQAWMKNSQTATRNWEQMVSLLGLTPELLID